MTHLTDIIRPETLQDQNIVETLTREAFWNVYRPGCVEHYVLHGFRQRPEFIPALTLVLETENGIIAHIMYSHAKIQCDNGDMIPIVVFGPVSVLPAYQHQGYGSKLIRYSLEQARSLGYGAVAITGNPAYYHRFGFVSGQSQGIFYADMPREADCPFFMIKELQDGYLKGVTGTYSDPQGYLVSDAEVDAFDRSFPPKEKKILPGQL